jgi:hypothetical protein
LIEKIEILGDQTLFLQSQLVQIRSKITRKSKFWCQLGVKLKKFAANNHFVKGIELRGLNWLKSGVKLKKIKILMVNWGLNINPRPRTNVKKELRQEQNCIKLEVYGQLGV